MDDKHATSDWKDERGKKWRDTLAGMEAMLAPVDEPLIRSLHLDRPHKIADVGCGGGGTTLLIAQQAPAGSVVHGYDVSPDLIKFARNRIVSDEAAIAFAIADVETASAPSTAYNRLVSRFSTMFFRNPRAAFANLRQWLAPGGRFAFGVWGAPTENPWRADVHGIVAGIVDLPPDDPEAPGPFRYADANKLVALLGHSGFEELDVVDWRGRLPIGGGLPAAEAATFALKSFGSFGEMLGEAGGEAFKKAHDLLTEHFSRHQQDNVVQMGACVHIVTGARSA